MTIHIDGVDISHWQDGVIDYGAAKKAGVKFIYHKATEGSTWRDGNYLRRRGEVRRAGIRFGAYHFARPTPSNALSEARWFMAVADPRPGDLIPVLDLEVNDKKMSQAALTKWVGTFVREINKRGLKVMIYTPFDLDNTFGCPLWVARYSNSMLAPRVPKPWKHYDLWQFSNGVYGKPNHVPGMGNVDINYMREGFTLNEMTIPKPVTEHDLEFWHFSMQFSDTNRQHRRDSNRAFAQGADIMTGTEAGNSPFRKIIKRVANNHGYKIHRWRGCWVAIPKSRVKRGSWRKGHVFVASNDEAYGKMHDRGFTWVSYYDLELKERVSVAAGHYATKGQTKRDPNHWINRKYAKALGKWARFRGKGTKLAFYGGDQNMVDRISDTFFGEPLTSAWDELKKWENTGHGNIDVIASYDRDKRVKARSIEALDDEELFMYTDHFPVKAVYTVKSRDSE